MRKPIRVQKSPLTNTIYSGHLIHGDQLWGENRTDVTAEACAAVAQHVIANGAPVIVSSHGKPLYEITKSGERERAGSPVL